MKKKRKKETLLRTRETTPHAIDRREPPPIQRPRKFSSNLFGSHFVGGGEWRLLSFFAHYSKQMGMAFQENLCVVYGIACALFSMVVLADTYYFSI